MNVYELLTGAFFRYSKVDFTKVKEKLHNYIKENKILDAFEYFEIIIDEYKTFKASL